MATTSLLLTALAAKPTLAETVHSEFAFRDMAIGQQSTAPAIRRRIWLLLRLVNQVSPTGQRYVKDTAIRKIASIASDQVHARQIWANAPEQAVLYQTATNFMQGSYPPPNELDQ